MKNELLISELKSLESFFNNEEIEEKNEILHPYETYKDTWTDYLEVYLSGDQKKMAFYLGKLSQLCWEEEQKVFWEIMLLTKCDGSDSEIEKTIRKLENIEEKNQVDALLSFIGKIIAGREIKDRKKIRRADIERLKKNITECEEKVSEARLDLRRHSGENNR